MEREIIELIARDRLEIPMSSLYQKVKRVKARDAKNLAKMVKGERFDSARVFAYVEREEDVMKARGMKDAVAEFTKEFPRYGAILKGKIEEKRAIAEEYLYFGVNSGSRLTTDDYIGVMQSLGLTEGTARTLYPELLKVSRKLAKEREEDRSVIVGKYDSEEE